MLAVPSGSGSGALWGPPLAFAAAFGEAELSRQSCCGHGPLSALCSRLQGPVALLSVPRVQKAGPPCVLSREGTSCTGCTVCGQRAPALSPVLSALRKDGQACFPSSSCSLVTPHYPLCARGDVGRQRHPPRAEAELGICRLQSSPGGAAAVLAVPLCGSPPLAGCSGAHRTCALLCPLQSSHVYCP